MYYFSIMDSFKINTHCYVYKVYSGVRLTVGNRHPVL